MSNMVPGAGPSDERVCPPIVGACGREMPLCGGIVSVVDQRFRTMPGFGLAWLQSGHGDRWGLPINIGHHPTLDAPNVERSAWKHGLMLAPEWPWPRPGVSWRLKRSRSDRQSPAVPVTGLEPSQAKSRHSPKPLIDDRHDAAAERHLLTASTDNGRAYPLIGGASTRHHI
ncbi:hypothetical protein FB451DRAFT_1174471 [Mycena latifolia]|nr:hypothetical protein FB451DRAFT_1187685 [Mycena latifolia]KAJ7473933.1 hypothetical protein FB451DRAFT_1174471 [Mycena latifolia]